MTTREELEKRIEPYWAPRPVWRGLSVDDGWIDLIDELVTDLEDSDDVFPEIYQIKSKFGGLRFYVGEASDDQHEAIRHYENKSLAVCELCGDPGEGVTIGHWYWTLCKRHAALKEFERREKIAQHLNDIEWPE